MDGTKRINGNGFGVVVVLSSARISFFTRGDSAYDACTACMRKSLSLERRTQHSMSAPVLACFRIVDSVVAIVIDIAMPLFCSCGHCILYCIIINAFRREIVSWGYIICTFRIQTAVNDKVPVKRVCCPFAIGPARHIFDSIRAKKTKQSSQVTRNEIFFLHQMLDTELNLASSERVAASVCVSVLRHTMRDTRCEMIWRTIFRNKVF